MNEKIQAFLRECGFAPTREDRVGVMRVFGREADAAIAGAPSSNPCNPGTFGWDGALGTNSFVDPVERLSLVVMIQNEPPFTTRNLTWGLRNPLYAALD